MAAISTFRVIQHSQIFSLFFRNQIQCIALYKLHNSQALLSLRHGYYSTTITFSQRNTKKSNQRFSQSLALRQISPNKI